MSRIFLNAPLMGLFLLSSPWSQATVGLQAQSLQPVPRVVVIGTGGTISISIDPATGKQKLLGAKEMVGLVPTLRGTVDIEEEDFSQIGSSSMTPELQFNLAQRVAS